jgi:BirA family biotin operon repressor/biotin-[acetyl-CoA-carboxylase] ligase
LKIVKLHATTSTNEELKSRFRESELPHLTTIYTIEQTKGKGQQGASWISEKGKNLTFSILITKNIEKISPLRINQVVSVTIVEWLKKELQVQTKIKWPNDILSVQHKLAGILIENTFSGEYLTHSIVGIGLNVNQEQFIDLPKAISLTQITGKKFHLEKLLISFLNELKNNLHDSIKVASRYNQHLYKCNQPTEFKCANENFTAVVKGTDAGGKLILDIDGVLKAYNLKELQWIY